MDLWNDDDDNNKWPCVRTSHVMSEEHITYLHKPLLHVNACSDKWKTNKMKLHGAG